ncbi:MAG: type I restriction endonuclease subunit R [Rhodobacteraceae bacterium]|nr:type I restriction endonuclease subunit R [Paracoccaceae bacterium]
MSVSVHPSYEPIALSGESTVVAEYLPETNTETSYQSEAELERGFIEQLRAQAYEYLPINTEDELICNLRQQLQRLNSIEFSDTEWDRFYSTCIAGANDGILKKTTRLQEDHIQILKCDDGTTRNIYLLHKKRIHNNFVQVINQYEAQGKRANRYDVTVLINGLPLVHIELKRRGVELREAFNQINRYQRESFWTGSGLFQYVQLFVISNGTLTKYYSNTVREGHLNEAKGRNRRSKRLTSNSYSFTSRWADAKNRTIPDLKGFTATFFAKHTLLNILTKYCVFDVDRKLLVMRPYQIAAVERMLQRILTSASEPKLLGKAGAGGYIWHATGSGKTLTSFKAAQLARTLPGVDKVLFVVDRKDLDYQTMREYERFEKGSADSNASTKVLQRQLEDPQARIIITTIQKLSRFVASNKTHPVYSARSVIIFDECHRSQFGQMHADITRAFQRYHLFGFTGTPIFSSNTGPQGDLSRHTTSQVFGDRLHSYTIVDAINDSNVLPFRIDYISTISIAPGIENKLVTAIDAERALLSHKRVTKVVKYVREHFDQKTRRNSRYFHNGKRVGGFNSIFATASIEAAKRYYAEFSSQQACLPAHERLKVGLIYSFAANEDQPDGLLGEEGFEAEALDENSRDFLDAAIKDYNAIFNTNFDTSSEKFQNYYKDISMRLKARELDLVIVVNMFLTGFDATTINTLWLDKGLRAHGLIQAYSRTNRILNSVKTYGNIVSFRNLETQTNEALALYGNEDAKSIALLKPYAEYVSEYRKLATRLLAAYPPDIPIKGEASRKDFVKIFGAILRFRNILTSFDDFAGNNDISERDLQNYQSIYLDVYAELRGQEHTDREIVDDDLVFEIELIKQIEVNVDYILMLVERAQHAEGVEQQKEIKASIQRAIDASPSLRDKKDLIEQFVNLVSPKHEVKIKWQAFVEDMKRRELNQIIRDEKLDEEETERFMEVVFRDAALPTSGTAITKVLPPLSRFGKDSGHAQKKQAVVDKLSTFLNRFLGLG